MTFRITRPNGTRLIAEPSIRPDKAAFLYISEGPTSYASDHLTADEVRLLIDTLEPLAAPPRPPRTIHDDFADLPLGAAFKLSGFEGVRVKVSSSHYALTRKDDGRTALYDTSLVLSEFDTLERVTP